MGTESAGAPGAQPVPEVRVIRSARRTRTIQAREVGGVVEVRIPASFTAAQEREAVEEMVARLRRKSTSSARSDTDLERRARELNRSVLEGRARPGSIRWVGNQNTRWGSCTVSTGDIRISDRLRDAPDYVLDSVIVHELTHTFIQGHSAEFWAWADRAPRAERARGYLEALQRLRGGQG
ncbi:M48 family metallopeptidase [Corynebacterium sp. UBA2622]|uniref:M48 metallopeptidase family protein n=1 Tax=Corynebacterium sp. UBA2622 TaxID=1946393 RepID=UPI0025BF648D|nr:SprT-like domain-containing protein [Corynebacterium sp. UBA2622]